MCTCVPCGIDWAVVVSGHVDQRRASGRRVCFLATAVLLLSSAAAGQVATTGEDSHWVGYISANVETSPLCVLTSGSLTVYDDPQLQKSLADLSCKMPNGMRSIVALPLTALHDDAWRLVQVALPEFSGPAFVKAGEMKEQNGIVCSFELENWSKTAIDKLIVEFDGVPVANCEQLAVDGKFRFRVWKLGKEADAEKFLKALDGKLTVWGSVTGKRWERAIVQIRPDADGAGQMTCPACKGSGKKNCSKCGGRGKVEIELPPGDVVVRNGERVTSITQDCPVCRGSSGPACGRCKGSGSVPKSRLAASLNYSSDTAPPSPALLKYIDDAKARNERLGAAEPNLAGGEASAGRVRRFTPELVGDMLKSASTKQIAPLGPEPIRVELTYTGPLGYDDLAATMAKEPVVQRIQAVAPDPENSKRWLVGAVLYGSSARTGSGKRSCLVNLAFALSPTNEQRLLLEKAVAKRRLTLGVTWTWKPDGVGYNADARMEGATFVGQVVEWSILDEDRAGTVDRNAFLITKERLRPPPSVRTALGVSDLGTLLVMAAVHNDMRLLERDTFRCTLTCSGRDVREAAGRTPGYGDVCLNIEKVGWDAAWNSFTVVAILDAIVIDLNGRVSGHEITLTLPIEASSADRAKIEQGFKTGRLKLTVTWQPARCGYEKDKGIEHAAYMGKVLDWSID